MCAATMPHVSGSATGRRLRVISVAATVVIAISGVIAYVRPRLQSVPMRQAAEAPTVTHGCRLLIVDSRGPPRAVVLVGGSAGGKNLHRARSDPFGVVGFPCEWLNTSVSVCEAGDGREITVVTLIPSDSGPIRVVLPSD